MKLPGLTAIIPARGGSKGVPRKNVQLIGGRPMICWTIEAALSAGSVERVIVSTDDDEIADVAREAGADVPFRRPAELATDESSGIDALLHAIDQLESAGQDIANILVLQPTSPLRTAEDIDAAAQLFVEHSADAVVSVTPAPHPVQWFRRISEDGRLLDYLDQTISRRQEAAPLYHLNGAVYLIRRDVLVSSKTFFTERTFAYTMPAERSMDIDTPWDFYVADLILKDAHGR